MAFTCVKNTKIGLGRYSDGTWLLPFFADVTGTWSLWIEDSIFDFSATEGEIIVLPDEFTNDAYNTFQLRRPDDTLFNNTCYTVFISYGVASDPEEPKRITQQGKITITLDGETALSYQNNLLKDLADWDVFVEGAYQHDGITYNPDGTFTWSFETGNSLTIKYYKI